MSEAPSKHASKMTDTEFDAARKASAWRTPPTVETKSLEKKLPTGKPAFEMTDAEFDAARKNHAWRG